MGVFATATLMGNVLTVDVHQQEAGPVGGSSPDYSDERANIIQTDHPVAGAATAVSYSNDFDARRGFPVEIGRASCRERV